MDQGKPIRIIHKVLMEGRLHYWVQWSDDSKRFYRFDKLQPDLIELAERWDIENNHYEKIVSLTASEIRIQDLIIGHMPVMAYTNPNWTPQFQSLMVEEQRKECHKRTSSVEKEENFQHQVQQHGFQQPWKEKDPIQIDSDVNNEESLISKSNLEQSLSPLPRIRARARPKPQQKRNRKNVMEEIANQETFDRDCKIIETRFSSPNQTEPEFMVHFKNQQEPEWLTYAEAKQQCRTQLFRFIVQTYINQNKK